MCLLQEYKLIYKLENRIVLLYNINADGRLDLKGLINLYK